MSQQATTSRLATAIALIVPLMLASAPVDAKSKARTKPLPRPEAATNERQQVSRQVETYDDIRANSLDPAGNYKGFPSWARAAFSNPSRDN